MGAEVGRVLGRMGLVEIVGALRPGRGSSDELWEVGMAFGGRCRGC